MESRLYLSADPLAYFPSDYSPENSYRLANQYFVENSAYAAPNPAATAGDPIGLEEIHETYGLTGRGQTVAVIDTGIAYDHTALGGGFGSGYRVVGGYDFTDERDGNPYDDGPYGSHGTHVAGIIGGEDAAHPGVAPEVDLVALRIFDDNGASYFDWVEEALQWVHRNRNCFENPITTVNISLGVYWNAETIPPWAMLEDEFAQLEADGVFISVAAGNHFASFNQPGLSYPAVSPHVVPVASVDPNGALSSFSQRDGRVIAAPGRAVTSSVPDYVGNYNGVNDDFAQYSGTSMASPYVAGASVLIREAYQLAGVEHVNQQTIYNLMVQTADTVYDPATGQNYHRLNLGAAIDAIYPDVPAETADWGVVVQDTFEGYRLDARGQQFTVTAAANAVLTIEARFHRTQGGVELQLLDAAGRQVGLHSSSAGAERIDFLADGGQRLTLRARAIAGGVIEDVDFRVTNLVLQQGSTVRVWGTEADDTFLFRAGGRREMTINGVVYGLDSSVVHSVVFLGLGGRDSATLIGNAGSDSAVLQPGNAVLRGQGYEARAVGIEVSDIRAEGGKDAATFYDSAGDDRYVGTPDYGRLSGNGYQNIAWGVEEIQVRATSGHDTAQFYDSPGNEVFVVTPGWASFLGGGFAHHAAGFDRVGADALAGGRDTANLYDSAKNDRLSAAGNRVSIAAGSDVTRVYGFERVRARSNHGGSDSAEIAAVDFVLELDGRWAR